MKSFPLKLIILNILFLLSPHPSEASTYPKPVVKYFESTIQPLKIPSPKQIASMETRLIDAINNERIKQYLKPLLLWKELSVIAVGHNDDMANGKVNFGHDGFEDRAAQIRKIASVQSFGENVAYSYLVDDPVKVAVDMWMNSPGHRKNILGDYEETGIAICCNKNGRYYFTQLFAKRF